MFLAASFGVHCCDFITCVRNTVAEIVSKPCFTVYCDMSICLSVGLVLEIIMDTFDSHTK